MKSLLVLRHAKSDWSVEGQDDADRVLNKRGRGDLPRVGRAIAAAGTPDLILSSSAARARETAQGVAEFLGDVPLRFEDRMYLASPDTLHAVLAEQTGDANCVLTVAHNPGMEEWIHQLCGARIALPTAGLAWIDFGADRWDRIGLGSGQLRFYVIPRLLKAMESQV